MQPPQHVTGTSTQYLVGKLIMVLIGIDPRSPVKQSDIYIYTKLKDLDQLDWSVTSGLAINLDHYVYNTIK